MITSKSKVRAIKARKAEMERIKALPPSSDLTVEPGGIKVTLFGRGRGIVSPYSKFEQNAVRRTVDLKVRANQLH